MVDKIARYETLLRQVKSLVAGEDNVVGVLANVCAAMREAFPDDYFWVGFYLVRDDELQLGPFQGPVACYRIKYGKGVCGTAWAERRVIIVPDVEAFPGHIACSSLSRSEIVVPIYNNENSILGVIDIDSRALNTFDETDGKWLEEVSAVVATMF